MKRRTIKTLLLALSLTFATAAFIGCENEQTQTPTAVEIQGFEVKEEITVSSGSVVRPESVFVTETGGEVLDVWVEVTDSKGAIVGLNANSFSAYDKNGYTITYVVRASDNQTYRKTTAVKVIGASSDIELSATYENVVDAQKAITITPVCNVENATFTYTVTHENESVEVENATFTPLDYGVYDVKITATADELVGEYSYQFFARTPSEKGEIEKYNAEWTEYAAFRGDKRANSWAVTDSATENLKDRNGRDATFFTLKTSDEYIRCYLLPRNDSAYYATLAEEGYTKISTWVYIKGTVGHITRLSVDSASSTFYKKSGPNVPANTWTEITLNLVDGQKDYERSFVTAYPYYADFSSEFILIDNSNAYNTEGGHEDDITIYFSDYFAVKTQEITAKSDKKTEYKIGDQFNATDLFDQATIDEYGLIFNITQNGETKPLENGYVFEENSKYTISVVSKRQDLELMGDI